MASHVVVIDSTARRQQIKTTPNKSLSEVLEEACSKFNVKASQYGLKHNNKQVDLSRTIRLSGLSSGAKLELVQLSRSAGVVSVALQLPESDSQGVPNARLTDKFPSSTTLWLVLRKFEAGIAGGAPARNLTAKGSPSANTGAGRLYYQQPVIQIMGRELASFTDLQKSLAQLGFNAGSALLKLSFRPTDTPLEEALTEIQGYFDSVDSQAPVPTARQPPPAEELTNLINPGDEAATEKSFSQPAGAEVSVAPAQTAFAGGSQPSVFSQPGTMPDPQPVSGNRQVSVFSAPISTVPSAVLQSHNEADYVPSIEHAQLHQKLLQQSSVNKRLLTDAELDSQATARQQELASIKEVEIKIRFPDESAVSAKFDQADSASSLYSFARDCLDSSLKAEPFVLRNPGVRGKGETVPEDASKSLIKDLQLRGRVLVVFGWDERNASLAARGSRQILKEELRSYAKAPTAPDLPTLSANDEDGVRVNIGKAKATESGGDGESKTKKLPKWLKGLSKK